MAEYAGFFQSIGYLTALGFILAIGIGIPTVLGEVVRQRGRLKAQVAELQAWREVQVRQIAPSPLQEAQNRAYLESVEIQREGHAHVKVQYESYLRGLAMQESGIRIAEARLEEAKRTNALLEALISLMRERA
jgi:hypothetical protein